MWRSYLKALLAIAAGGLIVAGSGTAVGAPARSNGTTLAAYKTIDICTASDTSWLLSGQIAVWNEGAVDTTGLLIIDKIQTANGGGFSDAFVCQTFSGPQIVAGTTQTTATLFSYSCSSAPLTGDIRNVATITITNHSGSLGILKGPEPKATYTGANPPPPCAAPPLGCTYTQGYWGNKPGVTWPAPYLRDATFFLSGQTWQQVLDTPVNVSQGYYQLAHQYIAAVLNEANGASVPTGVNDTLVLAAAWLATNTPSACTANGSCGQQKDWAAVLDLYNNGLYVPGGPPHCGDE